MLESGRYTMPDGAIWEVGTLTQRDTFNWKPQSFVSAMPGTPKLFLTIQSFNGATPVIARARNVSAAGFEVRLFEPEAQMDWHSAETIGYLAIYAPGDRGEIEILQNAWAKGSYRLARTVANHNPSAEVTGLGRPFRLTVVEDQTLDTEQFHTLEQLDIFALFRSFGDRTSVLAQDVSTRGVDTAAPALVE